LALPGSLVVITYVPVLVVAGCADHRLPRADRVLIVGLHLASSSLADRPSTSTAHDHASDGERHKDGVDGDDYRPRGLALREWTRHTGVVISYHLFGVAEGRLR